MTRDLSSALTLVYKIAYPIVWAAGSGYFGVMLYLHPEKVRYEGVMGAAPSWFVYAWIAMASAGTAFIIRYFRRFKYVGLEDGTLLVSNYWTDWRVPLSEIESVRQTRSMKPPHITITLKKDLGFGTEVIFMPKSQVLFSSANPNREVEELQQLAGLDAQRQ